MNNNEIKANLKQIIDMVKDECINLDSIYVDSLKLAIDKLPETHRLFTYGTLKKGEKNHYILAGDNARYIEDSYKVGYALYDTEHGFPMCVYTGKEDDIVHGEIYEVEDLTNLDMLEGYAGENSPLNFYDRRKDNNEWIYTIRRDKLPVGNVQINIPWSSKVNEMNIQQFYDMTEKFYERLGRHYLD